MLQASQDGRHVLDSGGLGIRGGIGRIVALAVAAHVPHDDLKAVLQCCDLAVPHAAGRAVAVRQQDGGALPVHFVMDRHAVAIEPCHGRFLRPYRRVRSHAAQSSGRAGQGTMASYEHIGVTQSGIVATIEVRRGPNNFVDTDMVGEIADVLEGFDRTPEVRAIVLCAEGKHFCAGRGFLQPRAGWGEPRHQAGTASI